MHICALVNRQSHGKTAPRRQQGQLNENFLDGPANLLIVSSRVRTDDSLEEHFGRSSCFNHGCIGDLRACRRRAPYPGIDAESRRLHGRFLVSNVAACGCGTSHFFRRLLLGFPPRHAPSLEGFVKRQNRSTPAAIFGSCEQSMDAIELDTARPGPYRVLLGAMRTSVSRCSLKIPGGFRLSSAVVRSNSNAIALSPNKGLAELDIE
jgi:hypothetical protein